MIKFEFALHSHQAFETTFSLRLGGVLRSDSDDRLLRLLVVGMADWVACLLWLEPTELMLPLFGMLLPDVTFCCRFVTSVLLPFEVEVLLLTVGRGAGCLLVLDAFLRLLKLILTLASVMIAVEVQVVVVVLAASTQVIEVLLANVVMVVLVVVGLTLQQEEPEDDILG